MRTRTRYWLGVGLVLVAVLTLFWTVWAKPSLAEDPPQDPETEMAQRIADSRSRCELGKMYEASGDLNRAEQYFQEAITLWPDNTEAMAGIQRILEARKKAAEPPTSPSFWQSLFSWLPGFGTSGNLFTAALELFGYILMLVLVIGVFLRLGKETIRLAILKSKGIPLLGLGQFSDPNGKLPGLPHQLATYMNDAGLTIYDEKGIVPPDFNFIGESGFPQAKLVQKMLELVYTRQVQRIDLAITTEGPLLNASISLVDSANGYVRYLRVVAVDQEQYKGVGDLVKVVSRLVADATLIALSRDPNTRGLLYQRIGDWSSALKEFLTAAEAARKANSCATYYQAHLNLGNLYSFLGLQDKSIAAYTEVAARAKNPTTLTLIQAAMACSYKYWEMSSPPSQQGNYEWLARQAIEKALASTVRTALIAYTIACYYSLSGQIEDCLRWLREAVAGDLTYLEYVLTDPDMENLRKWLNGRSPGEAIGLRV